MDRKTLLSSFVGTCAALLFGAAVKYAATEIADAVEDRRRAKMPFDHVVEEFGFDCDCSEVLGAVVEDENGTYSILCGDLHIERSESTWKCDHCGRPTNWRCAALESAVCSGDCAEALGDSRVSEFSLPSYED